MTEAEVMLWSRLRRKEMHGVHFRRQHPIGPFIADFACLVIEVDGATHLTDTEISYDRRRDVYMTQRGWKVIRVRNAEVYENVDGVLEMILSHTPPPSRAGARATSPAAAGEEN